jgi:pimeloyl-ACP methyl ester carboxylesterase
MSAVKVSPFRIAVPEATLSSVRAKVTEWSAPPAPADEGADDWGRGCSTAWLAGLRRHWLEAYDWRAAEAALNQWPQIMAEVDGQTIHAFHVVGEAGGKRPLVLTHGWPGSVAEFLDVIGPLAFPSRHGGDPADAFDLVIPALPGYGFSGRPQKPLGQRATAALWRRLMVEGLGYPRFLAQGGDWGSMVTTWLGLEHADAVAAIHLNMIGMRPTPADPRTAEEVAWLKNAQIAFQMGGAYLMMQTTRPQTLALALHGNPMGQAAWILEKFHGWSDLAAGGGTLDGLYGKDRLLTNLMFYVLTDAFQTSVWYYRALFEENGGNSLPDGVRVERPTAFANFPGETLLPAPPRSWAERAYNVSRWTDMPKGGHFAAMEQPALFVEELRAWGREAWPA